ncbi:MAG: hypothetical protein ABI353_19360 [Isosphaeraceae bacterium]
MRSGRFVVVVALGSLGLAGTVLAQDGEHKLDPAKVPAVVRQAIDKAVPGVKWAGATQEVQTFFHLDGKDSKGRKVEASMAPDGTILELKTTLAVTDVPKAVTSAVVAQAPKGFRVAEILAVAPGGQLAGYLFTGKGADGKPVEIAATPDGKMVQVAASDPSPAKAVK